MLTSTSMLALRWMAGRPQAGDQPIHAQTTAEMPCHEPPHPPSSCTTRGQNNPWQGRAGKSGPVGPPTRPPAHATTHLPLRSAM
jgi:hypothetical protein